MRQRVIGSIPQCTDFVAIAKSRSNKERRNLEWRSWRPAIPLGMTKRASPPPGFSERGRGSGRAGAQPFFGLAGGGEKGGTEGPGPAPLPSFDPAFVRLLASGASGPGKPWFAGSSG